MEEIRLENKRFPVFWTTIVVSLGLQLRSSVQDNLHVKFISYDTDMHSASQQDMYCKDFIVAETFTYYFCPTSVPFCSSVKVK